MADIDDARQLQAYLLHNAEILEEKIRGTKYLGGGSGVSGIVPNLNGKLLPAPQIVRGCQEGTINTLVSTITPKQQKDFINLPDALLKHLAPYVKVYKTYTIQVEQGEYEEFDILLTQGRVANQSNRSRDNKCEGVILRSVEFQRLGGNPEEVDTNIKFTLELFAKDVCSYFKRDSIGKNTEIGKRLAELTQRSLSSAQARSAINGTAWIDLIKIDPGQELDATPASSNSQMVTSNAECKIKVELGYSEIDNSNRRYTNLDQAEWQAWKDTVEAQKEVFYLSLLGHKFDFRGFQGVNLQVNYVASANAAQLSPFANIIGNPANQVEIEQKKDEKNLALEEKRYYVRERKDATGDRLTAINRCIDEKDTEIQTLEEEINEIQKRLKLGLLNQLYLWGYYRGRNKRKTRVYRYRGQPQAPEVFRTWGSKLQESAPGFADQRAVQQVDFDIAMGDEQFDFRFTNREIEDSPGVSVNFIFLGDIIEAAYELLAPSGGKVELSYSRWVKPRWRFRRKYSEHDWSFEPRFDEGLQKERFLLALKEFGGVAMGRCVYDSPVLLAERRNIGIMNIPIQLDLFRNWFLETYVTSNVRTLPLRDFTSALFKWVSEEIFRSIPYELGSAEVPDDTPKFVVNNTLVDKYYLFRMYDRDTQLTTDNTQGTWLDVYFRNNPGYNKGDDINYPVMFIDQVDGGIGGSIVQNGKVNLGNSIPHIIFGAATKGIVKKITFQREDIPGHAEARLFSDRQSVAGNIALREKYNVDFEMIGTTAFLPGSVLYLDPKPLDLGFEADNAQNPNYAKSLGMGGLYRVVNLTSRLTFDGQGNSWDTKLVTKWETFANGQAGASTSPPQQDATLEACIAANIASIRRSREMDQARFDGNY